MFSYKPKRLYQEIGFKLHDDLLQGKYKIGDKLPPERVISELFNVSRTVVREALIMLELGGLIDVRKGSGVYIIKLPSSEMPRTPELLDDIGPFEMIQARQLIESNIAEFAATQVTKSDISKMKKALEIERLEINSGSEKHSGDKLFHQLIAQSTQNSILVDMLESLWILREKSPMWKQLHARIAKQEYRTEWLNDHAKILSALQKCDPKEAKKAMNQHLENVKNSLLALSNVDDPNFDGYLFHANPIDIIK